MPVTLPSIPDPQNNVSSLQETVLALKQAVELLAGTRGKGSQQAASASDVTSVSNQVGTLSGSLTTTQGDVTTAQSDITTLQGNITTLVGDISTIVGDISTIESEIAAIPPSTRVLLSTLTASNSASLQDTSSLTSTYNDYEIVLENIVPVNNNVQLSLQVEQSGSFVTSYSSSVYIQAGTSGGTGGGSAQANIQLSSTIVPNTAGFGVSGTIRLFGVPTTLMKTITGLLTENGKLVSLAGNPTSAGAAVTGVKITFGSGNISTGVMKIYGLV